jgi:hypothetical protein
MSCESNQMKVSSSRQFRRKRALGFVTLRFEKAPIPATTTEVSTTPRAFFFCPRLAGTPSFPFFPLQAYRFRDLCFADTFQIS